MEPLLVRAARGETTPRPPVWLMRQAGRHIPEYRAIREEHTFLEAIKNPEIAAEITMLPWEYYRPDGLVMFSDILTVLEPLGFSYHIEPGVGPVVENPIESPEDVEREFGDIPDELDYVGDLLVRLNQRVGDETAIIGFAGGPFTLASYVVAGGPSATHLPLRKLRARHPDAFRMLLETFTDVVVEYLDFQIGNGADVVQLFDTYAATLSPADYREYILPLHQRIFEDLSVPGIIFVRRMNGRLDLLADTGADVVSLDWTVEMAEARKQLGAVPVQGNLDPSYLYGSQAFVREKTSELIDAAGPTGHILNLGHGVDKDTPVESVEAFVNTAKAFDWNL